MKRFIIIIKEIVLSILLTFPNTYFFCKLRSTFYRYLGCNVGKEVSIAANVRITGCFSIDSFSSIAHNCTFSGRKLGISIGKYVMIAPGCVFVSFDHAFNNLEIPMVKQGVIEAPIVIEDDVWIGANCTITKGVTLKKGSIVAANSVVTKDVESYSIYGGVPAKFLKKKE